MKLNKEPKLTIDTTKFIFPDNSSKMLIREEIITDIVGVPNLLSILEKIFGNRLSLDKAKIVLEEL